MREIMNERITCKISTKSPEEVETAIDYITTAIQRAAWESTPKQQMTEKIIHYSANIKDKPTEKRKLRKIWQKSRLPHDTSKLNKAIKKLKQPIKDEQNKSIEEYLESLSSTVNTDYLLWKLTRKIKKALQQFIPPIRQQNGNWIRTNKDKVRLFAEHFKKVFEPNHRETSDGQENENEILNYLESPLQTEPPIQKIKVKKYKEIQTIIDKELKVNKAPGYDLTMGNELNQLPQKAIRLLTIIYNAVLRLNYFPAQWKVAQIILYPKPGKASEEITSYRSISLLYLFYAKY